MSVVVLTNSIMAFLAEPSVQEPFHRNTVQDPLRPANSDLEASFADIRGFRRKSKSIGIEMAPDSMLAMATDTAGLVANCCGKDMEGAVQIVGPVPGKSWSDQFGESD